MHRWLETSVDPMGSISDELRFDQKTLSLRRKLASVYGYTNGSKKVVLRKTLKDFLGKYSKIMIRLK
jgi:hypothetical protein